MANPTPPSTVDPPGGPALIPENFHFGVATAGFQIEGGYNGPGEPRNNWYGWESAGRVEPSGAALAFWERYEEHLDRTKALGCDSFRMSVEWARVEPEEGRIDDTALSGYRQILLACRERDLMPLVTLHHFTHPWWLGEDFWLTRDAPERFARWVGLALDHLADLCSHWVTTNECNILALQSWLLGTFPPGKVGALASAVCALDHLLAGHVLAYAEIRARQPDAVVATNNFSLSIYELDRLPLDLLLARHHGVEWHALGDWLAERRAEHYRRVPRSRGRAQRILEHGLRRLATRTIPLDEAYPRATQAIYNGPHPRLLDVAQLDYYVPGAAEHFALPGRTGPGGRCWSPGTMLWEDRPDPGGLTTYCELAVEPGLDVWVVENGMCNRVRRGRSHQRLDGWTRDHYLRENLAALVEAIGRGLPVTGYWHWTLADNYEWGSYEPRFGLFGVDRERGIAITDTDAMGVDAAGTYRALIAGLRKGDGSVLGRP